MEVSPTLGMAYICEYVIRVYSQRVTLIPVGLGSPPQRVRLDPRVVELQHAEGVGFAGEPQRAQAPRTMHLH